MAVWKGEGRCGWNDGCSGCWLNVKTGENPDDTRAGAAWEGGAAVDGAGENAGAAGSLARVLSGLTAAAGEDELAVLD